jgi:hypothetical protein
MKILSVSTDHYLSPTTPFLAPIALRTIHSRSLGSANDRRRHDRAAPDTVPSHVNERSASKRSAEQ